VSTDRDGEALDDASARDHAGSCAACGAWIASVDDLTRRYRVRSTGSPDVVSAALGRWAAGEPADPQRTTGRAVLLIAGVIGLALSALAVAGAPAGRAVGEHLGRDLAGLQGALAVGFLLAARRPERYGRGLLPVALAAVAVVLLPSAADTAALVTDPLAELAHLPVLAGLVGLLLLFDPTRAAARRPELPA
jgi:predicted anti-sigma-YlaC factor YlaD